MKTNIWKTVVLAFLIWAGNCFAQMIPPGGGGTNGGGGIGSNSYSFFPPNTNFLIAIQNTNVVLNWRSSTNKIFLLEHRVNLSSQVPWGELTNYYLSAANTNFTKFVHTNIVKTQPTGFYRVFDVTPVARVDFFGVDQDSSANRLGIFQNDSSPNDDLFYLTNVVSAQHGGISYTLDASVFEYTPDSGFYGVDNFRYNITSRHGEISSNATVTVFVNQSGNSSPVAPNIVITLPTNTYAASFNALTNTTDPDGDTNILFAVSTPNLGSVSNSADGTITYVRNPNLFGSDAFDYTFTDGKGGYGVCHVKILQVDSDSDGMLDEWELKNGLDPLTDDSMSDVDGDGLPNLAEFVLRTNPNSANNILDLQSITNGTRFSGFTKILLAGYDQTLSTLPVVLYLNGNPAENSFLIKGPDGQWQINWDTTLLTNGNYQIQAGLQFNPNTAPGENGIVFGQPKIIQVTNQIVFAKLTTKFTDFLLIDAKLAKTNATFDVHLYDENGNGLVYATGLSASGGHILLYWDLTDGNGNQIAFGHVQAVFSIYQPPNSSVVVPHTSDPPTTTSRWFLKDLDALGKNIFSVAWGWDSYTANLSGSRRLLMESGVVDILGNPAVNSYFLLPAQNIPLAASTFRYDTDDDRDILMRALGVSGNFFFFGHGSDGTYDAICGNTLKSNIRPDEVGQLLDNKAYLSTIKNPKYNRRPYYLAILNACNTYSHDWAGSFGIDYSAKGTADSSDDYLQVDRYPRAFVGWSKFIKVPSNYDPAQFAHAQYAEALASMFSSWMNGYPLNYCLGRFSTNALAAFPSFTGADSWMISGCYDLQRN